MGARCVRQAAEQTVERPEELPSTSTDDIKLSELIKAAGEGDIDTARYQVRECGADVNAGDADGVTALLRAASCGHLHVVAFLAAECGADVNAATNNGVTALMMAAAGNNDWSAWIVEFLVYELGADVDATDKDGTTALMMAAAKGNDDTVRYLGQECGANVNAANTHGTTALMMAAAKGNDAIVRYLGQECGANVAAANYFGTTALMMAAENGRIDVVRYLEQDWGVDAMARARALLMATTKGHSDVARYLADKCDTPLNSVTAYATSNLANDFKTAGMLLAVANPQEYGHWSSGVRVEELNAAIKQNRDVVRWLIGESSVTLKTTMLMIAAARGHIGVIRDLAGKLGADGSELPLKPEGRLIAMINGPEFGVTVNDLNAALLVAASNDRVETIEFLFDKYEADVNAIDNDGNTALMLAAGAGRLEVIRYLAEECSVNAATTNNEGATALMKAAGNGHIPIVRYLAEECGVNVDGIDGDGNSALMLAAAKRHLNCIQYLATECGSDVNAADRAGCTALMQACAKQHMDVIQCLTKVCAADVNRSDNHGTTALMRATAEGHLDVVQYLAGECAADVNAVDSDGRSAVRLAADYGHQDIQDYFTSFLIPNQQNPSATAPIPASLIDSKASWFIHPSEIALINVVDTINVGGEYRAMWLDSDVAVKLFIADASHHASFESEVYLWHRLRHPNVIKMYGACDVSPLQFFVCEHASNGSLLEHVLSTPRQKVWSFLHQAALGLEYLHERGIVHGDLRCSNILIGSDGLSKLTNFARSYRVNRRQILSKVESIRWQAPEISEGKGISYASDVYSLGMCILEATTKKIPWKDRCSDRYINVFKTHWTPEMKYDTWGPKCSSDDARNVVWRMCCKNPDKRMNLSSVVHELERLAVQESVSFHQPEYEPTTNSDSHRCGETKELWLGVEESMQKCDNDLYHQAFTELKGLWGRLQGDSHSFTIFDQFYKVLRDFRLIITMSSGQTRVLQLSATRTTRSSIIGFRRHIESLWTALGESVDDARQRQARWDQLGNKQIEIFVSEASKSYFLLAELKSQEDRLVVLSALEEMIHYSLQYAPHHLAVLKDAYEDIARTLGVDELLEQRVPKWFIPWYELVIDMNNPWGSGGYGCVFRAKWLDSEVVAKRLIGSGIEVDISSSLSCCLSTQQRATINPTKRAGTMAMFRREVGIWFGLSHPHVVRLFGACHVGRPFFVCEYATNGTLVSYLRKHPDKIWSKLHEAALGVQYLHARGVVHGDLKGNNIVIGSDRKAKVTDFGLSSSIDDEDNAEISAASHWVAPECIVRDVARPTYASDIYSLGMCIVEALRVVEAGEDSMKICLPWGNLENNIVRYHVKHRELPSRPKISKDDQWKLVQQMCAFDPEKRLKISTVVDELARLAGTPHKYHAEVTTSIMGLESVPTVISTARERLVRLQNGAANRDKAPYSLYGVMWDGLDQLSRLIDSQLDPASVAAFCSLIEDADASTNKLQSMTRSLAALAESTFECYTLQRRVAKFAEAHSIQSPYRGWKVGGDTKSPVPGAAGH